MPFLKNFGLTAPREAIRHPRLGNQARCISALYEANFPKTKTKDFWKVLVECLKDVERQHPINLIGVCSIQIKADRDFFFKQGNQKKKELALEWLWMGIKKAVEFYEWDLAPFQTAYDAVKAKNYVNHWIYGKPKKNQSKDFVARVECDHDVEAFTATLVVDDRNGKEVFRKKIFSELPTEFCFAQHLGKLAWEGNSKVIFTAKNGKIMISAMI